MILYKLTKKDNTTYAGCKWGKGITHTVSGKGKTLYSNEVIHAYRHLNLALLLNPIHGNHIPCHIWEAEGEVIVGDWGKVAVHELTTTKRLRQPEWYRTKKARQRVQIQFAILCAEAVLNYFNQKYPNDDRPRKGIKAAKAYLENPSYAAAYAAAYAAYAAAYAAYAADAAAYATYIANAAAYAAANAANAADKLDFYKLANKAVGIIMNHNP